MKRGGRLALVLCLLATGSGRAQQTAPAAPVATLSEPVLIVDGEPVRRAELEDWLLRERGLLLKEAFARSFTVRRAAREAGVALAPGALRAAVEAEVLERLAGAFAGERAPWVAELASVERSETGHVVERSLLLETELLLEALARRESLAPDELEARLLRERALVPEPALARAGPPEEPVLQIGGEPVPRAEYGRWLRLYRGEVEARRFAESGALRRTALALGIAPSDAEVEARAKADTEEFVRSFYGGDRELWLRRLQREGRTIEDHERQALAVARTTMLLEGLARARRTVGDEELRAAFDERYGPAGEELRLRWIRIDFELPPPVSDGSEASEEARRTALVRARARAISEALELRERALEGQDFAVLAERHSDDALTAPRGGAPPESFRPSELAPELRTALAATAVGDVSEPTVAAEACWIFEVLDRRSVSFEVLREELRRELLARPVSTDEAVRLRSEIQGAVRFQVLPAMFADAELR